MKIKKIIFLTILLFFISFAIGKFFEPEHRMNLFHPISRLFYLSSDGCELCGNIGRIICRVCEGDGVCKACKGDKRCSQYHHENSCFICKDTGVILRTRERSINISLFGLRAGLGLQYVGCPTTHTCKGDKICVICSGTGKKICPSCQNKNKQNDCSVVFSYNLNY